MQGLKVSTVHSFQGQERRVIIMDFSNDNIRPTRLTAKWELVNVALSRVGDTENEPNEDIDRSQFLRA